MNPLVALAYVLAAIVLYVLGCICWLYLVGLKVRRHEAAERALRLRLAADRRDPAKTAGGAVGKGYTGGWGRDAYNIPDETAVEPTRAERLP